MTQQTSPFLEGKYGWALGESNWNLGMDDNLLKFSYLFDRNVNGVVSSLPAAVNGQAYFLTTDNRIYYAVGTLFYSTPVPKWFIFSLITGEFYQFNGTTAVQIDNPQQVEDKLDDIQTVVDALGTAAFEDTTAFATPADIAALVTNGSSINATSSGGVTSRTLANRFAEKINVKNFGAIGDGAADDTPAIQAAINSATSGCTIYFPAGFYKITAELNIPNTVIYRFIGDGMYASRIFVGSVGSISSVFETNNALIYDTLEIKDLGLLCNSKSGSGLHSEHIIHSLVDRVLVLGSTSVAIRMNDGYNNTIQNCILTGGVNGIDVSGSNINNVNILRNQIYANSGYGVNVGNALQVNVWGNGIEANAVAGIMTYSCKSFSVRGNYFERNSGTGFTFTSPETFNVKADIHLLSSGRVIDATAGESVDCCSIVDNHFTPYGTGDIPSAGLSIDCPVFSNVLTSVDITNNQVFDITKIGAMVGLYNNNTRANITGLNISHNSVNSFKFLGVGVISFCLNTAHNILDPDRMLAGNLARQDLPLYSVLAGTTGTIARSSQNLNGTYPAWDLSTGDRIYGETLTLSAYPELKGKHVWFGVYYRVQDASGTGIQLRLSSGVTTNTDNDGSITETTTVAGVWKFKSACKFIDPSDTTLTFGLTRIGAGGTPLVVSHPILAVFGSAASRFQIPHPAPIEINGTAAPTTGTWTVGNRVINSVPTVGQPKAWTCTVGGTPGTWVSEGNL